MSFTLQGINLLGIKSKVEADMINALRGWYLNAIGLDNFKATNQSSASPASQICITCDRVRLWDQSGNSSAIAKEVDLMVDLAVSGPGGLDTGSVSADTWYYLWLLGKCPADDGLATGLAGLASLSGSSPAMPAGYFHQRLAGVCRTGTGGDLKGFAQLGANWLYSERQQVVYLTASTARITQSLSAFMPPEALMALINYRSYSPYSTSEAGGELFVYAAENNIAGFDSDKIEESQVTVWLPTPGQQFDYRWTVSAGSGNTLYIWCDGFRWPIHKEP